MIDKVLWSNLWKGLNLAMSLVCISLFFFFPESVDVLIGNQTMLILILWTACNFIHLLYVLPFLFTYLQILPPQEVFHLSCAFSYYLWRHTWSWQIAIALEEFLNLRHVYRHTRTSIKLWVSSVNFCPILIFK